MKTPVAAFALDAANHSFEIRNYNWARPFSSFLPGIAGPWGVPAWAFWVNRGQAIAGLGAAPTDRERLPCGRATLLSGQWRRTSIVSASSWLS